MSATFYNACSTTMESQTTVDDDAPLPLTELLGRLSAETLEWIEGIEKQNDEDADEPPAANLLFGNDEEETSARIEEWISSTNNPDGVGGYQNSDSHEASATVNQHEPSVSVKYILSDSPGGHGDDVWAAARHVSNLFANPPKCQALLNSNEESPLLGVKILELGAGAGLPSWTAMKCGAKVVSTDQPIANRIRCMAESAERNYRDMVSELSVNDPRLMYAREARVCPHSWGDTNVTGILGNGRDDGQKFDVIVAADCVYNPAFHSLLLDSIDMLMADDGLALLPFALHGNTEDESVWAIVPLAKERGFVVEILESQQLSPQISTMNPKRGLVNMLRLTRNRTS